MSRAFVQFELFPFFQRNEGLFPIGALAGKPSQSLDLSANVHHIDAGNLDLEKSFDSLLDLNLICTRMDEKPDRIALLTQAL